MLRYVITCRGGSRIEPKNVLSARLDCELDVPADSLTLTLPFDGRLREADTVEAYQGETLRFFGQADEVISVRQGERLVTRVTARSLAALLLDNEAEPLTYNNPSNKLMFDRHLAPFGITSYDEERHPLYNDLRIDKGMSHWQALEAFCLKRYGSAPRIEGRRAFLRGYGREGTVLFGENGVRCLSLNESLRRHRLISEVKVKFNSANGYSSSVKNANPLCDGVRRVRYVNAAADNVNLDAAWHMIDKGNRASYLLRLDCAGARPDLLGMPAVVEDSGLGRIEGLRVTGVKYTMNEKGELTTVSLRKEQF